ncbi:hypothetical protein MRX96_037161 [Rhipicephalus microplus]
MWPPALQVKVVNPSWSGNARRSCLVTPAWTETMTWISYPEFNLLLTSSPVTTMIVRGDVLHVAVAAPAEVPYGFVAVLKGGRRHTGQRASVITSARTPRRRA